MELKEIKNELWRIGQTYPTFAGLLQKPIANSGMTYGNRWAELIKINNLAWDHFGNVVDLYAEGRRALPDPADSLITIIIAEVLDIMRREQDRLDQYEKYHAPSRSKGANEFVHNDAVGSIACKLGGLRQRKILTQEEHDEKFEQLMNWEFKNGPKPEWLQTNGDCDVDIR
jgi:hypothetical protein